MLVDISLLQILFFLLRMFRTCVISATPIRSVGFLKVWPRVSLFAFYILHCSCDQLKHPHVPERSDLAMRFNMTNFIRRTRPWWLSWMRVRLVIRRLHARTPPGRQHSFVKIDHEIFSTVIFSLRLIQEGQLSVSGETICTILVRGLSLPSKSVVK